MSCRPMWPFWPACCIKLISEALLASDMRMCAYAASVCVDSDVVPADAPAAAKKILRCQLLAAARQTVAQGIQLLGQASQAVARMAASGDKALPRLPPPKACSSIVVQLRLLDGQVITQPMVSIAATGTFMKQQSCPLQSEALMNRYLSIEKQPLVLLMS